VFVEKVSQPVGRRLFCGNNISKNTSGFTSFISKLRNGLCQHPPTIEEDIRPGGNKTDDIISVLSRTSEKNWTSPRKKFREENL
jgi:hypothetical protein